MQKAYRCITTNAHTHRHTNGIHTVHVVLTLCCTVCINAHNTHCTTTCKHIHLNIVYAVQLHAVHTVYTVYLCVTICIPPTHHITHAAVKAMIRGKSNAMTTAVTGKATCRANKCISGTPPAPSMSELGVIGRISERRSRRNINTVK